MPAAKPATATLSAEGGLVPPQALCERRGWEAGARLVVEETGEGALLKRQPSQVRFAPTRMEDVFGVLKYEGPTVTSEDMKRASPRAPPSATSAASTASSACLVSPSKPPMRSPVR